ncbi:MAG: nitrate- and nitrite sensing domain-containing protein, partial [Verrucomicrobiota bacterium]
MNFSLNSLSFAQRLLFITAVPVVGLTAFTLVILFDHIAETRELNSEIESVAELSELSAQLANTIHEWQKERGRSAGFIGSGGTKFSSEIRSQHESTDNLMADLEEIVHSHDFSKYGGEFQSRIDRGKTLMSDIEEWRSQILKLEVPASKAVGYYTSMINNYLDLIESIPQLTDHSEISLLVVSYAKFLRAKENMGIERAVLSNAFGADAFKGDFFIRYCTVIANQKSYLYAFKAFAKPEHIAFYQETVRGPQVDKVAAWEKLAFDKAEAGGFGVDPSAWFAEITGKIDLMKEVED